MAMTKVAFLLFLLLACLMVSDITGHNADDCDCDRDHASSKNLPLHPPSSSPTMSPPNAPTALAPAPVSSMASATEFSVFVIAFLAAATVPVILS
ncbi:hypothetical protein OPV22_023667 [Ensete ventricosum]|uniref:Uncharacterized protein n=1 Tax=Ensete ventricosum TaxID=4639 RepID=A0AAV8QP38_ENSVE|nr:hypothetical protein OPV22_023667 [Ensete ventricosum]